MYIQVINRMRIFWHLLETCENIFYDIHMGMLRLSECYPFDINLVKLQFYWCEAVLFK